MAKTPPIKDWPASNVRKATVADLVPYARNARHHTPEQIDQIAASIAEFGWTVPVLVDEAGEIIAGHGRVMAAEQLGIKTVPAATVTGWSKDKRRAYALADNKLALSSSWDIEMLASELEELGESDFDLALTGFSDDELGRISDDAAELALGLEMAEDGFPGGLQADTPEGEEAAADGPENGSQAASNYSLSVPMDYEQRQEAFTILREIKKSNGYDTTADALLHALRLCKE